MASKRQRKQKAKAQRHSQRAARPKVVKDQKAVLEPGDARKTVIDSVHGRTVRVVMEYQTYSAEYDDGSLAERIAAEMYGAARMVDVRVYAGQRPSDIVHGEILTPDGRMVVTKWIPLEDELLMLDARPATAEDLATLDRYGEPLHETEPRKAAARARIAELERAGSDADDIGEDIAQPSILEAAQQ